MAINIKSNLFFFSNTKRFGACLAFALTLLLVQMYLNTGTLAAYAVTLQNPFVMEGYIVNYDFTHYQCNYNFVMGETADKWIHGWVLRRELFYILSYPLFKLFGFYVGGVLSAFTITLVSFYFFIKFIYKNIGIKPAYVAMALLGTYPGIMYWIGSPFAQVMIVPCCCWIYIIMWKMKHTESFKMHMVYLSFIAILFTAYDLYAFFYPAILLIYVKQRQWKKIIVSVPIILIPQIAIILWLKARGATEINSTNSSIYFKIMQAYFHVDDYSAWLALIVQVPQILVRNFLDSSFLFLPIAFLILSIIGYFKKFKLNDIESSILIVALLVFLFNNLAPPYTFGDSMRGAWIARIYQPVFIVMLLYSIRLSAVTLNNRGFEAKAFIAVIVMCTCLNLIINIGGILKSKLTQTVWYHFYEHAPQNTMFENLKKYGVRPIGFPE